MLQKIYKNITVSDEPYVFNSEPAVNAEAETEDSLEARQRRLEEQIMQSELNIKQQEESILGAAKAQASRIVGEAEQQGEMIKNKMSQEGLLNGLRLAAEEYCEEYLKLEKYKQQLKIGCDERIKSIEDQIIEIAFVLAEKITDIEISRNDEAFFAAVKNALERVKDDKELAVELSQANAQRIDRMEIRETFKTRVNENFGIDDMLLHSEHGTIDMSIRSRFENLKKELLDKLK
ncbi:MAG: hypothetical protein J1F64_01640 [Oscillospiraceae bacterium]|nr:hypothetical protein [Oscillospiraceae bacterium]